MYRNTKILFYFSVIVSAICYKFSNEPYPFFSWKLFTEPSGVGHINKEYRIYIIKNKDTIRFSIVDDKIFDKNDHFYYMHYEGTKIVQRKVNNLTIDYFKKRFGDYADAATADASDHYLFIEEEYNPIEIYKDSTKFKKTILLDVQQY